MLFYVFLCIKRNVNKKRPIIAGLLKNDKMIKMYAMYIIFSILDGNVAVCIESALSMKYN